MSGTNSPVDEPPGADGVQPPNPPDLPPLPDWGPGENPPGTNPPVDPPVDPATVPVPGSVPTHDQGGSAPIVSSPPVNVDVPVITQDGDTLSCTMGNWNNEPTSYAYEWTIDGVVSSAIGATYGVLPTDVGVTAFCSVTATNAAGSTEAPPSNEITIADPAGAVEEETGRRKHRRHE